MEATRSILIDSGFFKFRVDTQISTVFKNASLLYSAEPFTNQSFDFWVEVNQIKNFRRFFRPQVNFRCDNAAPFLPLPLDQAYPLLEWGMNWCITAHECNFLVIHAAVLAKDDKAIVFPAPPGSGKSTLTAILAYSGWRLLSDELTIIDPKTLEIIPCLRPICLKNSSIEIIKNQFPDVVATEAVHDTTKGSVAHFAPPKTSLTHRNRRAEIAAIVYPRFSPDTALDVVKLSSLTAFDHLVTNGFNHNLLQRKGFDVLSNCASKLPSFYMEYCDQQKADEFLSDLVS